MAPEDDPPDVDALRRALERIRDHQPSGPRDEWSLALAFHEVQRIALEALDPGVRAMRLRSERARRVAVRLRVNALRRGERYFCSDNHGGGAWVRFLRGDGEREGVVHVEVIERVVGATFPGVPAVGSRITLHVDRLQTAFDVLPSSRKEE